MGLRRFNRLTNAFSTKMENHCHALAIYFMHCNFRRIHQTLRVTPAMAAGVSDKLWELAGAVKVVDDWERGNVQITEREFGCDTSYAPKDSRTHNQRGRTRKYGSWPRTRQKWSPIKD